MQSPDIQLKAQLHDHRNGSRLVHDLPWVRPHSLLSSFIIGMFVQASQTDTTAVDISGTEQLLRAGSHNFACDAVAGEKDLGIVVGTGTTPPAMSDFSLQTPLTANLAYAAPSFAIEAPNASTYRLSISRGFTNNSGAQITVQEVALYSELTWSGGYETFCLDRTLYEVIIAAGLTLTLTYRLTITL